MTTKTKSQSFDPAVEARRISNARVAILLDDPFFGSMLMQLKCIEDASIPTFCTDGVVIRYSPHFSATLTDSQIRGVLIHELHHVIYLHPWRRENRHPKGFNIACDHVINLSMVNWIETLKSRGLVSAYELPEGGCCDPQYKGLCEEEVYAKLPKDGGGGDGGDGYGGDGNGFGEVEDAPGNESQRRESLDQAKINIVNAVNIAKMAGKLPAGMERYAEEITTAKVDWKTKLMAFVVTTLRDDYSYRKPRPLWLADDIVLPGLYGEGCGHVVVAVDTSGSIGDNILNAFAAEMRSIHQTVKPEKLTVIYVDAEVAHVDTFNPHDTFELNPKGGGGTDFRPVFDYVEEQGIRPVCLIYLTDGQGTFPETPPPYPVLWVLTEPCEVPFGESVEIYED